MQLVDAVILAIMLFAAGHALVAHEMARADPSRQTVPLTLNDRSHTHQISSDVLQYDLELKVILPHTYDASRQAAYPALYVTDGYLMQSDGHLIDSLEAIQSEGLVQPVVTILLSAAEPGNPANNRRNQQFLCNPDFAVFFRRELIPFVEKHYHLDTSARSRTLMGISFGGLNALYFAAHTSKLFKHYAVLSPITYPCHDLIDQLAVSNGAGQAVFLSTGTDNDAQAYTPSIKAALQARNWNVSYHELPYGHDFSNWRQLYREVFTWMQISLNASIEAEVSND